MAGEFFYPNITGTFDWGTLLDGLMKVESVRLNKLKAKEAFLDQEIKYYRQLKSKLEDIYDFAANINPKDWFNKKKLDNLTPDIVDAKLISNDVPEYTARGKVEQVATIEMDYFSKSYKDPDKSFASQNDEVNDDDEFHLEIHYKPVNGDEIDKVITFYGKDSLNDLIDKINNDPDIGKYIHAYAKYTGDGYQLALMETDVKNSKDESESGTREDTGDLERVLGDRVIMQGAKNSKIKIGDDEYTDPGYEFRDLFPGVVLTVKKEGDFQFQVKQDFEGIADVFVKLVNKVNDAIRTINDLTKITRDGDKVSAPKLSDYSLKSLKEQLQKLFFPLLDVNKKISKYNIIDYNPNDGTVQVNKSALIKFLKENPKDDWQILYDVVKDAKKLSDLAINDAYVGPALKSLESERRTVEERISEYQDYLNEKYEYYKIRFGRIESYIASLQNTQMKINQLLTSLLNTSNK